MKSRPGSSFRKSLALIILFLGAFFAFGAGSLLTVHAQSGGTEYFKTRIFKSDGKTQGEFIINGPSQPPAGYGLQRASVNLLEPGLAGSIHSLAVPAYDWVYGCSAVSGGMIAAYYDRNGYPNMYTGPTNGGVMPMDNSGWGTWPDSVGRSWPFNPLSASRLGFDGRTIRGSTDDYWLYENSPETLPDPFIGNWTQHTWGDAIGDYMKTSQSSYGNKDGWTAFYYNPGSAEPLTCTQMETRMDRAHSFAYQDGTYGRKLFYEARGYTVTDCYTQQTDNQVAGGFSLAQYKAEINAGRPVMINVEGHTMVGIGYDDATTTIYVNDTWDHTNHPMTWGGSYEGMTLWSVSIVNLAPNAPPAAFNKASPGNASTQTRKPNLTWQASAGAASYDYCLDDTPGTTCTTSWITTNANTSVLVGPLSLGPHYWQVRAHNGIGDTTANGGTWYSFTVVQGKLVYLPIINKPIPLPGNFGKVSPGNGATGQPASPTLSWAKSTGVVSYEYCLATSACTPASTWTPVGAGTSVSPGSLNVNTTYYWQVRARNTGGDTYADGGNPWTFSTAPLTAAWTTVMSEDFEGTFPGSTWSLYYQDNYAWGKRSCRPYGGSYSGWIVGGGSNGASLGCGSNYPSQSDSWMVYGPFDLTNATAADLSFKGWVNSGNNGPLADDNDVLCARASLDNDIFYGTCWWGTSDWFSDGLDLSDLGALGSVLGHDQVWIAFEFHTHPVTTTPGPTTYSEGAYVDNILLRKCTSASCSSGTSANDSGNSQPNSGFSVVTRPK